MTTPFQITLSDRFCDQCGCTELSPVYHPPTSIRKLTVHICDFCGLVQSLPRIDHVPTARPNVSADAGWGNIRYGKALRTTFSFKLLDRLVNYHELKYCLDLGASRGDFIYEMNRRAPQAGILAIEPDASLVHGYLAVPGVSVVCQRIEHLCILPACMDLIYCSHTLEHLASPIRTLQTLARALTPGGMAFVEVPNLDFIDRDDLVEEWFLDKHLYHFDVKCLMGMIRRVGLTVVEDSVVVDDTYISLVLSRQTARPAAVVETPVPGRHVQEKKDRIERYTLRLRNNTRRLAAMGKHINELADQGLHIVVWGAGRILDALVRYGGLDPDRLQGIIDTYLADLVPEVHGCKVLPPKALTAFNPDMVIIASREYAEQIASQTRAILPECRILKFHDLWSKGARTLMTRIRS